MEGKSIEQLQLESEQVQKVYLAIIEEFKGQVAELSYELALNKALNANKDENIQSLIEKIGELESKLSETKEGDE